MLSHRHYHDAGWYLRDVLKTISESGVIDCAKEKSVPSSIVQILSGSARISQTDPVGGSALWLFPKIQPEKVIQPS